MPVYDLSNYDYDYDYSHNPTTWPDLFLEAGCKGLIVGSQWVQKAHAQLTDASKAGIRIVGTYAEPNYETATRLALEFSAPMVGIVVEPGGIQDLNHILQACEHVLDAGLQPYIYGNRGDLTAATNGTSVLAQYPLWFASYFNDGHLVDTVNFCGWTKVAIHQYSSTIVVAGRVRDHNHIFIDPEEDSLTPEEKKKLEDLYNAFCAGNQDLLDKWNANQNSLLLGYTLEQEKLGKVITKIGGIDA